MIVSDNERAVFHYAFKPLVKDFCTIPHDGGFSVTLYPDHSLLVTLYYDNDRPRGQIRYSVPASVITRMQEIVDDAGRWIGGISTSLKLQEGEQPRFISRIGLEGYPLLVCEDIPWLTRRPFMDADGRAARRLTSLMEDASEAIAPCGVLLGFEGFDVDIRRTFIISNNDGQDPWLGVSGF